MSFHVGQKVVCVDDTPTPGFTWGTGWRPIKDEIYTIAAIGLRGFHGPYQCVKLREQTGDWRFKASRFRPLIQRSTETGMAILRKVADDASKRKELTVCGND